MSRSAKVLFEGYLQEALSLYRKGDHKHDPCKEVFGQLYQEDIEDLLTRIHP